MSAKSLSELRLQKSAGLSEELAAILLRRIETGEFKLGDVLPPEKIFAESYKVSRTVVREALARLKYEGIIISRRGSGSIVVGTTPRKGFDLEDAGDLSGFFEFRLLLDSEAAAMAAVRHSKAQLIRLKEHLDSLAQAGEEQSNNTDPDYRFHCAVAEASDNEYIKVAMQQLAARMWSHIYTARRCACGPQAHAEHEAIFKAIAARDPAAARAAALGHLVGGAARSGIELDVRHLVWQPDALTFL